MTKTSNKIHIPKDIQKPKIKILLEGCNITSIIELVTLLKDEANRRGYRVKGPVSMPLKRHELSVRKAPGSFGSETYRRYRIQRYKKILYFYNSQLESILVEFCNLSKFDSIDKKIEIN